MSSTKGNQHGSQKDPKAMQCEGNLCCLVIDHHRKLHSIIKFWADVTPENADCSTKPVAATEQQQ